MNDLRRLQDICWIARRIENRQLGFRIEEFVSSQSREYISNASKASANLPVKEVVSNDKKGIARKSRKNK